MTPLVVAEVNGQALDRTCYLRTSDYRGGGGGGGGGESRTCDYHMGEGGGEAEHVTTIWEGGGEAEHVTVFDHC